MRTRRPLSRQARGALIVALVMLASGAVVAVSGASPPGRPEARAAMVIPPILPVYSMTAPVVDQNSVIALANQMDGVQSSVVLSNTSHMGTPRWSVFDGESEHVVEQYGATGGFFVFNPTYAFTDTLAVKPTANAQQICTFLSNSSFFPLDVDPAATNCASQNLPYGSTLIQAGIVTTTLGGSPPGSPITETFTLAQIWQVPLSIDVTKDITSPQMVTVPLAGPGGHLSLLVGNPNSPSLDSDLPGLQAIANPYMERQRFQSPLGVFAVYTPTIQDVLDHVQPRLPQGSRVFSLTLGTPELVFFVDDPAVEQKFLMPMWLYPEAVADVGTEKVPLRTLAVPAVQGFLPEVAISSPFDGTPYTAGQHLDVTASITGGTGVYSYSLSLEGGPVLAAGQAISGSVKITTTPLPLAGRPFEPEVNLTLVVTDTRGAGGQDALSLKAPARLFLPQSYNGSQIQQGSPLTGQQPGGEAPAAPSATRTMGVEWVRYYNDILPDLPAVEPDGRGFYTRMRALGWQGNFNWTNNAAWAKDWVDCSLGGIDCSSGVDRAEFIYFAGHGSPARIFFGVNRDTTSAFAGNARFQNVRWAAFATCKTMRAGPYITSGNPPLTDWFNAFQGAYMLLGFHSNMADVAFGPRFVDTMAPVKFLGMTLFQRSIREAWVLTAFQMNAGKPAYLYAVSNSFNPVDMRLPDNSATLPPLDASSITQYRWVWWEE